MSKIVYIPSYVEAGVGMLNQAKEMLSEISAGVAAGVATISGTNYQGGIPSFDTGEAASAEVSSLGGKIDYITHEIERYSSGNYIFQDGDLVIIDPNDKETIVKLRLKSDQIMSLEDYERQRGWSSIGYLGAKFLEGAVESVGSIIDGFASAVSLFTWGSWDDAIQDFVDKDYASSFFDSMYAEGGAWSDMAKMSYTSTSDKWATAAAIVEGVGSGVPYMVAGMAMAPVAGSAATAAAAKFGLGTLGKTAVKVGVNVAADLVAGSLGGLGRGTNTGLDEGLDLNASMATHGVSEIKEEVKASLTYGLIGEAGGEVIEAIGNRGLRNAIEEAASAATQKAITNLDDATIKAATQVDGALEAAAKNVDSLDSVAKNIGETNYAKLTTDDVEIDKAIKKFAKEQGVDITDQKAVDKAVREAAKDNVRDSVEKLYRADADEVFNDALNKRLRDVETGINNKKMSPDEWRTAANDSIVQDVQTRNGWKSADQITDDGWKEITQRQSKLQNASEYEYRREIIRNEQSAVKLQEADARIKHQDDYLKQNKVFIDNDVKQQLAGKTSKDLLADGRKVIATNAAGSVDDQIAIARRNLLSKQGAVSTVDSAMTSAVKSKLTSSLGTDISEKATKRLSKVFGSTSTSVIDKAANQASTAIRKAINEAASNGTKLSTAQIQEIGKEAAEKAIKYSSVGNKAAQKAIQELDDEFAVDMYNLKKGRISADDVRSKYSIDDSVSGMTKQNQTWGHRPNQQMTQNSNKPNSPNKPNQPNKPSGPSQPNNPNSPNKPNPVASQSNLKPEQVPSKPSEINWDSSKNSTVQTKTGDATIKEGTDGLGRKITETTEPDGKVTRTTTATSGTDTIEIKENYNKAGVKNQTIITTTDANGNVTERIVEGLDGRVVETRNWTDTNKYTATITKNDGTTAYRIKEVEIAPVTKDPINIKTKDADGHLLEEVATKAEPASTVKKLQVKDEKLLPNPDTEIKVTTKTTYDVSNGNPIGTNVTYEYNKLGAEVKVKELADGTTVQSSKFNDEITTHINYKNGNFTEIKEKFNPLDKSTVKTTTEVEAKTGKQQRTEVTTNADGTKITKIGLGKDATIKTETYNPKTYTTTTETRKADGELVSTRTEKYDPVNRTKDVEIKDKEGKLIESTHKEYEKPTSDPLAATTPPTGPSSGPSTPPTGPSTGPSGPPSSGPSTLPPSTTPGLDPSTKNERKIHDNYGRETTITETKGQGPAGEEIIETTAHGPRGEETRIVKTTTKPDSNGTYTSTTRYETVDADGNFSVKEKIEKITNTYEADGKTLKSQEIEVTNPERTVITKNADGTTTTKTIGESTTTKKVEYSKDSNGADVIKTTSTTDGKTRTTTETVSKVTDSNGKVTTKTEMVVEAPNGKNTYISKAVADDKNFTIRTKTEDGKIKTIESVTDESGNVTRQITTREDLTKNTKTTKIEEYDLNEHTKTTATIDEKGKIKVVIDEADLGTGLKHQWDETADSRNLIEKWYAKRNGNIRTDIRDAFGETWITRKGRMGYMKDEAGNILNPIARNKRYIARGREELAQYYAERIARERGSNIITDEILAEANKKANSKWNIFQTIKARKLGKEALLDEGIAHGLKEVVQEAHQEGGEQLMRKAAVKEAALRAAGLVAGVTGINYLHDLGAGETVPPITDTVPDTVPTDTTAPPYNPIGGGGDPSSGGGGGSPSNTITDPSTVDPNETPIDIITPEEPTDSGSVEEEIINGATNPSTGNGGGQSWGSNGDGESFDETETDDELSDEDALLGDEDLEGLEDDDSIYTIPLSTEGSSTTSTVTKDGINPIPILAGLGLVAAAGVGAKIYMDNKKNNENGDDDEFMDDSEFSDFNSTDSDLIADEWTGDDLVEEKTEEGLDYERPSFYSDTLGDEI